VFTLNSEPEAGGVEWARIGPRDLECVSSERYGTSERDIFGLDALHIRPVSSVARVMGSRVK
jgi:hypothetical protein